MSHAIRIYRGRCITLDSLISVSHPRHRAFTLVEVLIVMSLMIVLAGIALPTAKELLSDQKATRAARSIATYIAQARSEAVAKGQYIGVRIERLTQTADVTYGSAASVRLLRVAGCSPLFG